MLKKQEACPEPIQTSNDWKALTVFAKHSILDFWISKEAGGILNTKFPKMRLQWKPLHVRSTVSDNISNTFNTSEQKLLFHNILFLNVFIQKQSVTSALQNSYSEKNSKTYRKATARVSNFQVAKARNSTNKGHLGSCFPANFKRFFRIPFLQNAHGWLLLL